MEASSVYPTYSLCEAKPQNVCLSYHVITKEEAECVPQTHRGKFTEGGQISVHEGLNETVYITPQKSSKASISKDCFVKFSAGVSNLFDYYGIASDLLCSAHKFNRKQNKPKPPAIHLSNDMKDSSNVLKLVEGKNRAKQVANGRGDEDGVPSHFQKLAKKLAEDHKLELTTFKGDELVQQGFRLMHAVGRASKNEPIFINLKYQGNPDSDSWVAFVGKGVCFDSGGLNIKPTAGIKDMYLDKHGAVSVFSAFQTLVEQKVKMNLTVSMGFVENYVGANSYRPSDIITSRKGLTVEIGNTDAQGRLVLADCMNWTQEKYKTQTLIQLSTLTGAMVIALGHRFAGVFSNNEGLTNDLKIAGKQVHDEVWEMPVNEYYHQVIKHKFADITNSSGKTEGSACQAAAFLQNFVEKGVKWVHMDIAGASMVNNQGNGYGARILIQYARNYAK